MKDVFIGCWSFFAKQLNIWDRFSYISKYELIILIVVFTLALVLGVFIYRLFFSITFAYIYITACAMFLPPIMGMQNTIAFFSVSGVMFSFLIFRCNRIGAFIICGVISGMIGYMIYPVSFNVIIAVLIAFLFVKLFPFHSVCVFTGLFGGLGFSSMLMIPDIFGVIYGVAGAFVQMWLFHNIDLFEQKYPAKIQYMIDKRKRAKA